VHTLEVIVPLVVPVITGLVGALGIALRDRRAAHDRRTVRATVLAEATAEVTFAKEWWAAQQALGGDAAPQSTERTADLLADAEAKVVGLRSLPVAEREGVSFDRLFLFRRLEGRQAKTLKVLFWVAIAFVAIAAISLASDAAANGEHAYVGSDLVLGVVSLFLVPIFHEAAEAADRRTRREPEERSSGTHAVRGSFG
jgi:hypothetical protein